MAGRPRKDEAKLDVASIIDAAWRLVDREGLDSLSSRTLATELDVRGPALYWHVRSMQELRSLMVEQLVTATIADPPPGQGWAEWLAGVGRAQRRKMLDHRDSGRIAAGATPTERMRTAVVPAMLAPLLRAGFAHAEAFAAAGTIASFVLGWVIYEQGEETGSYVASNANPDQAFEFALSAIVAGLQAKLG